MMEAVYCFDMISCFRVNMIQTSC